MLIRIQGFREEWHSILSCPPFYPFLWKAHLSQPTFLWFLPWQSSSWFDWQELSHISILISILKKSTFDDLHSWSIHWKKICGFIGTKKDKYFNKQTNEVQLTWTSVKHLPNIKFVLAVIVISISILWKAIVIIGGKSRMGGRYQVQKWKHLLPLGPMQILNVPLTGSQYVKTYIVSLWTCLLFLLLQLQTIPSLLSNKISLVSVPFLLAYFLKIIWYFCS